MISAMIFYLVAGPLVQFTLEAFYDFILPIFMTLQPQINALLNYSITYILFQDLYLNYCMIIECILVFCTDVLQTWKITTQI
jgi:hypothetical protein